MKTITKARPFSAAPWVKPAYLLLVVILAVTGFSQMPIMKRYYIADIPGFGWLAEYYVTHLIHYIGAALLLFLLTYSLLVYLSLDRKIFRPTLIAKIRSIVLIVLVVTGIFRVLKNLPDISFSPNFTLGIDITHLILAMLLIVAGLFAIITRSCWLRQRV